MRSLLRPEVELHMQIPGALLSASGAAASETLE